jgi:hypothetical protein
VPLRVAREAQHGPRILEMAASELLDDAARPLLQRKMDMGPSASTAILASAYGGWITGKQQPSSFLDDDECKVILRIIPSTGPNDSMSGDIERSVRWTATLNVVALVLALCSVRATTVYPDCNPHPARH